MNGARYSYLDTLCDLGRSNRDIVIVSADYAAPVFDDFKKSHPSQFLSVGIAEQNLIAVSCGLALEKKRVVAYGLSPFPVSRAYDQIKCALSNMRLPVNIVVSGVGFSEYGITHSNIEDISLMRTIPNMRIITPADNTTAIEAARYVLQSTMPTYIRFDKYAEGQIYEENDIKFNRGFSVLADGRDVVVITCGSFTSQVLKLVPEWQKNGIKPTIIDMYSLPVDSNALLSVINTTPILTIEEHIHHGGIGSFVLELFNDNGLKNSIKRMGIEFNGNYPQASGSREYYLKKFGLSDCDITEALYKLIGRKRIV